MAKKKCKKPASKPKYPYGTQSVKRDPFISPHEILTDFNKEKEMRYAEKNPEQTSAIIGMLGEMLGSAAGSIGGQMGDLAKISGPGASTMTKSLAPDDESLSLETLPNLSTIMSNFAYGGTAGDPPDKIVPDEWFEAQGIDIVNPLFSGMKLAGRRELFRHLVDKKDKLTPEEISYYDTYQAGEMDEAVKDVQKADPVKKFAMGGTAEGDPLKKIAKKKYQSLKTPENIEKWYQEYLQTVGVDVDKKTFEENYVDNILKGKIVENYLGNLTTETEKANIETRKKLGSFENMFAYGGKIEGDPPSWWEKVTSKQSPEDMIRGILSGNMKNPLDKNPSGDVRPIQSTKKYFIENVLQQPFTEDFGTEAEYNTFVDQQYQQYKLDSGIANSGAGSSFAFGGATGNVPVEVENDEMAMTPQGQSLEFSGPTHRQGGINTTLPAGTEIFSDRIKMDGKTMAEWEKERVKGEKKVMKKLEENPTDKVNKNTYERMKKNNDLQRQQHLQYQEKMKQMIQMSMGEPQKEMAAFGDINLGDIDWKNILGNINMGDVVGQAGNIYSAIAPMKLTQRERAGDTPNVNFLEGYGDDAMATIDEMKGLMAGKEEEALKDLERNKVSQKSQARKSARGINQMRMFDFLGDAASNKTAASIKGDFASKMAAILSKEAGVESDIDKTLAMGEREKVLADKMDRANYYTQLSQNVTGLGEGMQVIGKDLNQSKYNKMSQDLINELSNYGFKIVNGKLVKTDSNE